MTFWNNLKRKLLNRHQVTNNTFSFNFNIFKFYIKLEFRFFWIYVFLRFNVEKQGILGSQSFGEDCVKQFLCRLLVSDSAMELSRASSKMRVMNLLQDALNETDDSNDLYNTVSENQNLNNLSPSSYSIYEWNDLIQMILG